MDELDVMYHDVHKYMRKLLGGAPFSISCALAIMNGFDLMFNPDPLLDFCAKTRSSLHCYNYVIVQ